MFPAVDVSPCDLSLDLLRLPFYVFYFENVRRIIVLDIAELFSYDNELFYSEKFSEEFPNGTRTHNLLIAGEML